MDTEELTRWIRDEHVKVTDLSNHLRDLIAAAPHTHREAWLSNLRERFEHLRAHLIQHMALEEQDGYMVTVVERRPTLSDAVNRLRDEHREMMCLLNGIRQSVESLEPGDRLLVRDCCHRIGDFLSCLEQHDHQENLMILSVFTEDLGTSD